MRGASQRLGKYELIRRLAVGGMGEVFLARQRGEAGFDRRVVVKRMLPDLAESPDLVSLFIDEARIAAHLAHPNVVQVLDFGSDDGTYFMSMEYVAGENLARVLERAERADTRLPRDMAVHIVAEMARGLDAAHNATDADDKPLGIVHRDVSPHNVLVSYAGDVKLMDFGIAKASNKVHRTEAGVIRGKLSYMSPEQANGVELDARSDLFAVGIMLWELTLGQRLFDGDSAPEILRKVLEAPIPSPRAIDPEYPPALEYAVMACLERDVGKRTATAAELVASLRGYQAAADAHVNKADIGVLLRELFPEGSDEGDAVAGALTSSQAMTRELDGTADVSAAAASLSAAVALESTDVGPPAAPDKRVSGPVVVVGVLVSVVLAFWLIGQWYGRVDDALVEKLEADERERAALLAMTVLDAGPEPAIAADAAPVETAAADAAIPEPARTPKSRKQPRRSPPRDEPADDEPPVEPPPQPEPEPEPQQGTLVVGHGDGPYGMVFVDGAKWKNTNVQRMLPAGTVEVRVELSEGGGAVTGKATIGAGKKTKCLVSRGSLACGSPR
jgi:predicted Ser/Thr protein kinase